jgi:hypothetical protein
LPGLNNPPQRRRFASNRCIDSQPGKLTRAPRAACAPQLLLFLSAECAVLLAATLLPPRAGGAGAAAARPPRGGDTGWLSLLSVAATLIPAARRPLTLLRAALGVGVALADDAALFVLTLLLARATAAMYAPTLLLAAAA